MRHLSVTILLLALFACTAEPTLPEIEVRKVTEITETGAILRADIISSGNAYITSREFLWGTDPSLTKYNRLGAGDGENPIVCHLFGLAPATTYYFKLKVENAAGSVESQTLSFTTTGSQPGIPSVVWRADPYDIGEYQASFCAEVVSDGNAAVTESGFCWTTIAGVTPTVVAGQSVSLSNKGLGPFEASATKLAGNTTYYVRAWAKNAVGTGYSDVRTFKTEDPGRIRDVSIAEFTSADPSNTRRYRISGHIGYVYNPDNGIFYLEDDSNNYLLVYYTSTEALGYGNLDNKFNTLGLRVGDDVTVVGYRAQLSSSEACMAYAYVEKSSKLSINSFMGYWSIEATDMSTSTWHMWSNLYTQRNSAWDEGDNHYIMVYGMKPYVSNSEYSPDIMCVAEGYYNDATGRITLMAGLCAKGGGPWNYTSTPDTKYKCVFYPVKDNSGSWSTYSDAVMILEPCWQSGTLTLSYAGGDNSSQYYRYDDYVYDESTSTVTDQFYRSSNVWKFYSLSFLKSY